MSPRAGLLYDLAGLALVAAAAYFFFWGVLALVAPSLLITATLHLLERRALKSSS
ncbi:MAG: hypothetical protein ACE5HB_06010 [Terriglobia bacterium]